MEKKNKVPIWKKIVVFVVVLTILLMICIVPCYANGWNRMEDDTYFGNSVYITAPLTVRMENSSVSPGIFSVQDISGYYTNLNREYTGSSSNQQGNVYWMTDGYGYFPDFEFPFVRSVNTWFEATLQNGGTLWGDIISLNQRGAFFMCAEPYANAMNDWMSNQDDSVFYGYTLGGTDFTNFHNRTISQFTDYSIHYNGVIDITQDNVSNIPLPSEMTIRHYVDSSVSSGYTGDPSTSFQFTRTQLNSLLYNVVIEFDEIKKDADGKAVFNHRVVSVVSTGNDTWVYRDNIDYDFSLSDYNYIRALNVGDGIRNLPVALVEASFEPRLILRNLKQEFGITDYIKDITFKLVPIMKNGDTVLPMYQNWSSTQFLNLDVSDSHLSVAPMFNVGYNTFRYCRAGGVYTGEFIDAITGAYGDYYEWFGAPVAITLDNFSLVEWLGDTIGSIMDIELIGNISLSTVLYVAIGCGFVLMVLKFFAGG